MSRAFRSVLGALGVGSSSNSRRGHSSSSNRDEDEQRVKDFFTHCENNDADMVLAHLLEHPPLLHATDGKDFMTPLEVAAGFNSVDVCRVLVENGHSVDATDSKVRTPLLYACAWGSLDAVEFLLKHKANVNWSDAKGQTVLMEALHYKQLDCAKRLLKCPGLNLQAADHNGATALHLSAKVGYLEGVQLLLEAGARMSIADYDGYMPLHYCSDGYRDSRQAHVASMLERQDLSNPALAEKHVQKLKQQYKEEDEAHEAEKQLFFQTAIALAKHANYHVKSISYISVQDMRDHVVAALGIAEVLVAARSDPELSMEDQPLFNRIMQSVYRVVSKCDKFGKPQLLSLPLVELILSMLIADSDQNSMQMWSNVLPQVAPMAQHPLDALRLFGAYLLKAARVVISFQEPNAGYAWEFFHLYFDSFIKMLLSVRHRPEVAVCLPLIAHMFDPVWSTLCTVALVDIDGTVEDAYRFAVLIRAFFMWSQLFSSVDFLAPVQQWLPLAACSSSADQSDSSTTSSASPSAATSSSDESSPAAAVFLMRQSSTFAPTLPPRRCCAAHFPETKSESTAASLKRCLSCGVPASSATSSDLSQNHSDSCVDQVKQELSQLSFAENTSKGGSSPFSATFTVPSVRLPAHFIGRPPASDELFDTTDVIPKSSSSHASVTSSLFKMSVLKQMKRWVSHTEFPLGGLPPLSPEVSNTAASNDENGDEKALDLDEKSEASAISASAQPFAPASASSASSSEETESPYNSAVLSFLDKLPADLKQAAACPIYALPPAEQGGFQSLREVEEKMPISKTFAEFLAIHREQLLHLIRSSADILPSYLSFLLRIPEAIDVKVKASFVRSAIFGIEHESDEDDEDENGDESQNEDDDLDLDENGESQRNRNHNRNNRHNNLNAPIQIPLVEPDSQYEDYGDEYGNHHYSDEDNDENDDDGESEDGVEIELQRLGKTPNDVFLEWADRISDLDPLVMYRDLSIKFNDEAGIGNGPLRELFTMLTTALFSESSLLFEPTPDGNAWHLKKNLSPDTASHAARLYETVGRTLGLSFSRELPMDARVSIPLLKSCLGQKVHWSDVRFFDESLYRTLQPLITKKNTPEFWLGLDQRFVVTESVADGGHSDIELCPGGADMVVDEKNKHKYAEMLVKHRMFGSQHQTEALAAFCKGFQIMVPEEHGRILKADELQYLIAGEMSVNVDDLRKFLSVTGVNQDHEIVGWFLDEVASMSKEEHRQLLQFWSGSPVVPVHGFQPEHDSFAWTLHVTPEEDSSYLPSAATCSYLLKMPLYSTREQLGKNLRIAIAHGSAGFDQH